MDMEMKIIKPSKENIEESFSQIHRYGINIYKEDKNRNDDKVVLDEENIESEEFLFDFDDNDD